MITWNIDTQAKLNLECGLKVSQCLAIVFDNRSSNGIGHLPKSVGLRFLHSSAISGLSKVLGRCVCANSFLIFANSVRFWNVGFEIRPRQYAAWAQLKKAPRALPSWKICSALVLPAIKNLCSNAMSAFSTKAVPIK